MATAFNKTYTELYASHIADYRVLYDSVALDLGPSDIPEDVPTDIRVAEYGAKDKKLVELLFQFGRYLLIAEFSARNAGSEFTGNME